MSILSEPHFHNEAAALARLEFIVWPNGPHCPRCGGFDRITMVKGGVLVCVVVDLVNGNLQLRLEQCLNEAKFRFINGFRQRISLRLARRALARINCTAP